MIANSGSAKAKNRISKQNFKHLKENLQRQNLLHYFVSVSIAKLSIQCHNAVLASWMVAMCSECSCQHVELSAMCTHQVQPPIRYCALNGSQGAYTPLLV